MKNPSISYKREVAWIFLERSDERTDLDPHCHEATINVIDSSFSEGEWEEQKHGSLFEIGNLSPLPPSPNYSPTDKLYPQAQKVLRNTELQLHYLQHSEAM